MYKYFITNDEKKVASYITMDDEIKIYDLDYNTVFYNFITSVSITEFLEAWEISTKPSSIPFAIKGTKEITAQEIKELMEAITKTKF